jgi:hypothetical protein
VKILLIIICFLCSSYVFAQDAYFELLREDVRTQKVVLITDVMQFSDKEGEIFWPLYREYQFEFSKITDKKIAVIKDFAESYEEITDKKAKDLAKRTFEIEEDRIDLKKKYFKKFEKALSSKLAAKFFQLENQLNLLIDLQIVDDLPFIK